MWLILSKEIKEILRDRKTLFFMIALPILLFPAIMGLVIFVSANAAKEEATRTLSYALIGAQNAPQLVAELADSDEFAEQQVDLSGDFKALIQNETLDFVLEIPANFDATALESGQAVVTIYLNDASAVSSTYRRVNKIIETYTEQKQQAAFSQLNLSEDQQTALLEPVKLEKVSTADKREDIGEKIGGLLPYFIFILCLQGAMMPASDLGAGEKERGTLETLLISPTDRNTLVMGKFFTIAIAGIVSALITVGSMAVWGLVLSRGAAVEFVAEFMGQIGAIDFVLMFMMLIPVVAIFASVLLAMSIYARSYKEAQSYMGFLVMIVIVPVMLAMMPGIELEGVWTWVPLTNVALAIKELIKGTMDYFALFAIFASTAAIAGALIAFCVYWFKQEKVLFR